MKTLTETSEIQTDSIKSTFKKDINDRTLDKMVFGIITTIVGGGFPMAVYLYGNEGYYIGIIITTFLTFFDYFYSDATKRNIETAKLNGFSNQKIYGVIFFNLATWHLPIYVFVNLFASPYDPSHIHFDFRLLYQFGLALVLNDLAFYFSHKFLHNYLPENHKLHHCCKHPSFTTGIILEPLDLTIELGFPMVMAVMLFVVVFKDPFGMVCSICVFMMWYGLDHDEYFRLPHWYHHRYVNSIYSAYTSIKTYNEHDQVKKLLK